MSDSILAKYTRQPKIYTKLPSGGMFYEVNPFEKSSTGEIPVYSMTARDEMILKTPDALMNGESIALNIKSCMPLIEDPYDVPIIDLDAIIIALRIATYGEKMKLTVGVPNLENEELDYEIDLRVILDELMDRKWTNTFKYNDLVFHSKPLTLKDQNIIDLNTFETTRIVQALRVQNLSEEEKNKIVKDSFQRITDSNLNLVVKQIVAIETPEGTETNPTAIADFFNNTDSKVFGAVLDYLTEQKDNFSIPDRQVQVPKGLVDQGAPETISTPLIFNQSNFFV